VIRRWLCRRFGHRIKWLPLPASMDKIELCDRCGRVLTYLVLTKASEDRRGWDYHKGWDVDWPPLEMWERDQRLDR
jgi:hypothetical protein